jgi:hypothetical protein
LRLRKTPDAGVINVRDRRLRALLCFGLLFVLPLCAQEQRRAGSVSAFTVDHGAVVRGDLEKKRIALIFTGGEYGEGTAEILNTLKESGG